MLNNALRLKEARNTFTSRRRKRKEKNWLIGVGFPFNIKLGKKKTK